MSSPKPGECDHCWKPSVVTLAVGCKHEHLGTATPCAEHAPAYFARQMFCVRCLNNYPLIRVGGEPIRYHGHGCALLAQVVAVG